MATLIAIDQKQAMSLKPYQFEEDRDGWILCQLSFHKDQQCIFESIGAFLQITDLQDMVNKMNNVVNGIINEIELEPLEPNFRFKMRSIETENFEVITSYAKHFQYENGRINDKYWQKNYLSFFVTKFAIISFLNQLSSEIESIKAKGPIP